MISLRERIIFQTALIFVVRLRTFCILDLPEQALQLILAEELYLNWTFFLLIQGLRSQGEDILGKIKFHYF